MKKENKENEHNGLIFGLCFGVLFDAFLGHTGAGLAIGLAVGVAWDGWKKRQSDDSQK